MSLAITLKHLPTRSVVLSWYRKCIKAAFLVPWESDESALYVIEESRRLFYQNVSLVDPERIQRKIREVEMRYELALHYGIPYPRPYHKTQGTSNESAVTYAAYMDSAFDVGGSPYTAAYEEGNGYGGISGGSGDRQHFFEDASGTAVLEGRDHPNDTATQPLSTLTREISVALDLSWISDIHYDPLYGKKGAYGKCTTSAASAFGETGCDAPLALIQSALDDVSSFQNAFTILAGDWQRHQFPAANISTTDIFDPLSKGLAGIKTAGLPAQETADVAITLGNNDFIRDYYFNYTDPVQAFLEEQVGVMTTNKILTASAGGIMSSCGYYSAVSSGFRVITFNAFLWTYSIIPSIPDDEEDPCDQFAFMESQLSAASSNGEKVIVMGHVPPSLNAYRVINRDAFASLETDMYWKSGYQTRYFALLKKYSTTVVTHLYGHIHVFAILAFEEVGVPGFVIPSISPVFGNNANYLIASFSDALDLVGVRQRIFWKNGTWKDGENVVGALGLRYGFQNFSDLRLMIASLGTDSSKWSNYLSLHSGGSGVHEEFSGGNCDSSFCRSVTICSMLYTDMKSIDSCTRTVMYGSTVSTSVLPAVLIIVVSITSAAAIVAKLKYPIWRQKGIHVFPDVDWAKQLFGRSSKKRTTIPLRSENVDVRHEEVALFNTSQDTHEEPREGFRRDQDSPTEVCTPCAVEVHGDWDDRDDERPSEANIP